MKDSKIFFVIGAILLAIRISYQAMGGRNSNLESPNFLLAILFLFVLGVIFVMIERRKNINK